MHVYPLDDREIGRIPPIEFLFFGHARRSVETHILTYPRPMVSHMDLYYVPQRLVRCILAVFVTLDVTPRWTQMANARVPPIEITHFCMMLFCLIYQHPAQTNRHMGTLWGLLHRPNKKTRCAWRFSLFYWHMVWADVKPRAIAQSEQAQCQSAQIHFCILAHISLQELFYMHTKAICKPTTRCSQFYYLHCYATGSSSSNQCLNSMALMVVATSESGKYLTGPTTRRIHW